MLKANESKKIKGRNKEEFLTSYEKVLIYLDNSVKEDDENYKSFIFLNEYLKEIEKNKIKAFNGYLHNVDEVELSGSLYNLLDVFSNESVLSIMDKNKVNRKYIRRTIQNLIEINNQTYLFDNLYSDQNINNIKEVIEDNNIKSFDELMDIFFEGVNDLEIDICYDYPELNIFNNFKNVFNFLVSENHIEV